MAVTARPTLAPMPSLANELPDCPTTKWSVDNIDIAAEQVSIVNVFFLCILALDPRCSDAAVTGATPAGLGPAGTFSCPS